MQYRSQRGVKQPYELARRLLHTVREGIGYGHRLRGVPPGSGI
jgi:hypothetical protein